MGRALRKLLVCSMMLLFTGVALAAPTNSISTPNSFTANTVIQSSKVNDNNNEISTKYNAHSHTDITQLGTITTGTWQGTPVAVQYGGTGTDFSSVASGAIIYFNGTGTVTTLTKPASGSILYLNALTQTWAGLSQGTIGQVLTSNGASANPSFKDYTLLGSWASGVFNTSTLATTDGFIAVVFNGSGSSYSISVKTDSSNPPTTIRSVHTDADGSNYVSSAISPVKKGEYYLTESGAAATAYWIPLGS